ncbi:MAG: hypothetical protein HQL06_01570 [Nitrospirae bacterium]|nr:hypothetical protein [Nitrospirota bacterium]
MTSQDVYACTSGQEVEDHLRCDLCWIGRYSLFCHAVVGGKDKHHPFRYSKRLRLIDSCKAAGKLP